MSSYLFAPSLHEAVLKNSPWLVVQKGTIDMVGQRACAGCALARTQLERGQGVLSWLLWEFMLGQKPCPTPSLWHTCPSGLLWPAIAVLETGWGQPRRNVCLLFVWSESWSVWREGLPEPGGEPCGKRLLPPAAQPLPLCKQWLNPCKTEAVLVGSWQTCHWKPYTEAFETSVHQGPILIFELS